MQKRIATFVLNAYCKNTVASQTLNFSEVSHSVIIIIVIYVFPNMLERSWAFEVCGSVVKLKSEGFFF